MGRLPEEILARAESFSYRALDVVQALRGTDCPRRIVDQLVGCGTSVGANTFEADEALSRKDFCRTLGIIIKELNEARFWLRLIGGRGWVKPDRLEGLEKEAFELKRIYGAMLSRTREKDS